MAGAPCELDSDCGIAGLCGFTPGEPAAFQRGGNFAFGDASGVFALSVGGGASLWTQHPYFGFRCGR
jgi:hypothetical protein